METNNRELYEQFGSITGCKTNRRIAHYLEACDYDLATAVDLYFAQGGADTSQDNDVAMISDDDDEIECAQGPSRAIQPSTSRVTRQSRRNGRNHHVEEEEVRAPIPSTRGTMLEAGYHQQYGVRHVAPTDSVFNRRDFRADAVEQERNLRNALNAANAQPVVRELNGNQEAVHRSMLQDLFRPPTDISFSGPFEAAKEVACEMGKWLLVNVQDIKEFACQTLNRDIWSNEGVKELIQTNFVFWQIRHDSVDGQRLNNYYKLKAYPAIFILDPRTGELVQNFVMKKQDPVTLCDFLTSYLDKFPDYFAHDRFLKGVPHGSETDAFDPGNVPQFAAEPECSKSAMFDDEEMDRTLSRKRKANGNGEKIKKVKMQALDGLNDSTRMLSVVDKDEWKQHVARSGEICRIRLKLPDGKVEIIEITNSSKLKTLFVFLAGRNVCPKDHMFVLSFPRREYSLDEGLQSLSELGFAKNEMVHVELK